jgi:hypothetical protein
MAVKTTVELQVRVENVAWSRNLAPPGYPNRTTFCGSLCVVKETEDFEKNFVTPEFMLDLPCSSRLVVWLVSLEIEEADEPILRYKGLIRIIKHDGPNLKKLSTHLRNWVKFHSSGTKPKTVKTWISNMLYEIRHTSTDALTDVETHDELPITKRRSLWASLDWSTLPRPLRLYADGAWLASETLIELVGVCSSQRSAVLPIYWEQRCTDDSPELNRETPVTLTRFDLWHPLGWSVCHPFKSDSPYAFWSHEAVIAEPQLASTNSSPAFQAKAARKLKAFQTLCEKNLLVKHQSVWIWKHWSDQWFALWDLWLEKAGVENGGATLSATNCRTLISLRGSCDAFLYEWQGPKEDTTVFTTSTERAMALQTLGLHVTVVSLQGRFADYGVATSSSTPQKPQKSGVVRIRPNRVRYVFFDKAERWTFTHARNALKLLPDEKDVRIGVLVDSLLNLDGTARWKNPASPHAFSIFMDMYNADRVVHTCRHSDLPTLPAINNQIAHWKSLTNVYVADDKESRDDKIAVFYENHANALIVCERATQVADVLSAVYESSSRSKISLNERIYLINLDMHGTVIGFHTRIRSCNPKKIESRTVGMVSRPMDVCVKVGDQNLYFDVSELPMRKAGVIIPSALFGHTGYTLFVLDDQKWIRWQHLEEYLKRVDPQKAFLIGSTERLGRLLMEKTD